MTTSATAGARKRCIQEFLSSTGQLGTAHGGERRRSAATNADRTAGLIRTVVTALAIALPIIIALFLISRRFRGRSKEDRELQEMTELAELRAMMSDQTRPIALTAMEPPAALTYTLVPLIAPGDTERKRAEIDALAGNDPE